MEKENQSIPERKITLGFVISWILGVLIGVAGIPFLFQGQILSGIIFIIIALILLPPVSQYVKEKSGFSLSGGLKVALVIVLMIVAFSVSGTSSFAPVSSSGGGGENSAPQQAAIEIVDISTRVTESNSVWWKYAWNLTLKNNTDRDRTVTAEIKWVDADGFVVDDDTAYSLVVPANSEKTFNDYQLIDTSVAPDVEGIKAQVR